MGISQSIFRVFSGYFLGISWGYFPGISQVISRVFLEVFFGYFWGISRVFLGVLLRDAKSGKHGKHACAIFLPQTVLIFGSRRAAPVQLQIFEITTCTTCANVLFVGCAFAQLVQTAQFLQLQLTEVAQEP